MDYQPLNNQGDYEVNAELKAPISGAGLKEVVDAAPKYPACGHTVPKPEGATVEQAISNGFSAVCSVLRYGYQQVERAVNLCDKRLDPGIVWKGRLFYLIEDTPCENSCDQCAIKNLCDNLPDNHGLCNVISGDWDHHFKQL